ncbi:hypothetical protein SLE2022_074710 [Rubroshorea leprosula]
MLNLQKKGRWFGHVEVLSLSSLLPFAPSKSKHFLQIPWWWHCTLPFRTGLKQPDDSWAKSEGSVRLLILMIDITQAASGCHAGASSWPLAFYLRNGE